VGKHELADGKVLPSRGDGGGDAGDAHGAEQAEQRSGAERALGTGCGDGHFGAGDPGGEQGIGVGARRVQRHVGVQGHMQARARREQPQEHRGDSIATEQRWRHQVIRRRTFVGNRLAQHPGGGADTQRAFHLQAALWGEIGTEYGDRRAAGANGGVGRAW